jgi:hypothetical protein
MPGEQSEFDFAGCEAFFAPLAVTISVFASSRNLQIQKYYHDSPTWDLCFAHPIGGYGKVHLTRTDPETLQLSAAVWVDEFEQFTRYIRRAGPRPVERDSEVLMNALTQMLDDVLSWPFDAHFVAHQGYERHWGAMKKQEFLASEPAYPSPRKTPTN